MEKQLLIIALTSLLFVVTGSNNAKGQSTPNSSAIQATDETSLEKLKTQYAKTLDSLLLEERYQNIIEVGELLAMDREPEISKLPNPYLICAYHFIGNTERSKKLLNDTISKLDYNELIDLLTNNHIAFIKYFNAPGNRVPIIELAVSDYKKFAKATEKEAGEQIIRFFINDQSVRKVKYGFKKGDEINQDQIEKDFKLKDSLQNGNVLAFYKKYKRYLSEKEVGESIFWRQLIVLSHYDNIELRQTFFKDLLANAVKEGRMEKTSYVHFILRTESFTNTDFFKNLEKRMEEVRKEYDLPDYLWNPF